jgi:hypothetical protein
MMGKSGVRGKIRPDPKLQIPRPKLSKYHIIMKRAALAEEEEDEAVASCAMLPSPDAVTVNGLTVTKLIDDIIRGDFLGRQFTVHAPDFVQAFNNIVRVCPVPVPPSTVCCAVAPLFIPNPIHSSVRGDGDWAVTTTGGARWLVDAMSASPFGFLCDGEHRPGKAAGTIVGGEQPTGHLYPSLEKMLRLFPDLCLEPQPPAPKVISFGTGRLAPKLTTGWMPGDAGAWEGLKFTVFQQPTSTRRVFLSVAHNGAGYNDLKDVSDEQARVMKAVKGVVYGDRRSLSLQKGFDGAGERLAHQRGGQQEVHGQPERPS